MDHNTALIVLKNKKAWTFYEVNIKTLLLWLKTRIFSLATIESAKEKANQLNSEIENVYHYGYIKILYLDKIPCKRTLRKLLNED